MAFNVGPKVRLLSSSLLVGVATMASAPAFAKCTTTGTTTVCDATAPNPTQGPVTGGQVQVLNGSIVEDNGTFASVVAISPGGTLTTEAGSLIRSAAQNGAGVSLNGATGSVSGTVRTTGNMSATVSAANGSTFTLNSGGLIENLGTVTFGNDRFDHAGLIVLNSSAQVDGTVRTTGKLTNGIDTSRFSGFEVHNFSPATITIGATGVVDTSGDTAHGILTGGGSTITVAGSVAAHGVGSDGINANGGTSSTLTTITVTSTGKVTSDQGVGINAIAFSGRDVVVRGTVSGATAAIRVGGNLTMSTTAAITGAVQGNGARGETLTLVAEDAAHPAGQLAASTGFEQLNVVSGNWVAATGTTVVTGSGGTGGNVNIAQGSSLEVRNPGGAATVQSGSFTVNGTLVVNFANDASLLFLNDPKSNPLKANSIGGTGGLTFTGPATVTLGGGSLTYTGQTTVQNGKLLIVSPLPGGLTIGAGATASAAESTAGFSIASLDNAGTFSFDRSGDGTILGAVQGNGAFIKNGAGLLTVNGVYADTGTTTINQGTLRLAGGTDPTIGFTVDHGTLEFTKTAATISSLAGGSGGTVIIGSGVTLNQASDTTFAGALTGAGPFAKSGAGRLTLSGTSSYSGATTVSAGTLAVTGTLPSAIRLNAGRLEGTGTIGGLTAAGGTVAPGIGGIGTLNVGGAVSFAPGSVFAIDATAAGASDKIAATGAATLTGGSVQVLAQNGTYAPQTRYTILTAGGGVQGKFDGVTTNLAFLTPSLAYGANDVTLFLTRNDRKFSDLATSPNQVAVANAAQSLGLANPVFLAILQSSDSQAPAIFNSLSGEIYATLPALIADDSRAVRNALVWNSRTAPEGVALWGDGFTGSTHVDAASGLASARATGHGFIAGITWAGEGFSAGIGGGLGSARDNLADRQSRADVDSKYVGGHVGYRAGGFGARAGAAFFWHDISATRTLYGTLGPAAASFNGDTSRLFAEADYDLLPGDAMLAPFVAFDRVRTHLDGFAETGGAGRLTVAGDSYKASFATAGARFSAPIGGLGAATIVPRASVAYRHRLDQSGNTAAATFAGAGSAFTVTGFGLPRNAVDLEAGVDVEAGRFRIGARYQGSFADNWTDNGGAVTLSLRF